MSRVWNWCIRPDYPWTRVRTFGILIRSTAGLRVLLIADLNYRRSSIMERLVFWPPEGAGKHMAPLCRIAILLKVYITVTCISSQAHIFAPLAVTGGQMLEAWGWSDHEKFHSSWFWLGGVYRCTETEMSSRRRSKGYPAARIVQHEPPTTFD